MKKMQEHIEQRHGANRIGVQESYENYQSFVLDISTDQNMFELENYFYVQSKQIAGRENLSESSQSSVEDIEKSV